MGEDKVNVVVRVRPPSDPSNQTCNGVDLDFNQNSISVERSKTHRFEASYDRILDTSSTQQDLFNDIIPLLDSVIKGYHATVFAYGLKLAFKKSPFFFYHFRTNWLWEDIFNIWTSWGENGGNLKSR